MKVIVTGSTGLVGTALVRRCIKDDRITHALVLTRRALPEEVTKSDKITVIEHADFSTYPPELLKKLTGAEGCLWALGGKVNQFPDAATAKKVQVDYTLAAASAFVSSLAPQLPEGKAFRFVFCSGKYAEWDQNRSLAFMGDTRRFKGLAEKGLCDLADANAGRFQVWCARPSGIHPPNAGAIEKFAGKLVSSIGVDHLASAMVRILLDGYESRLIESETLLTFSE